MPFEWLRDSVAGNATRNDSGDTFESTFPFQQQTKYMYPDCKEATYGTLSRQPDDVEMSLDNQDGRFFPA